MWHNNILEVIGNTPLVRLNRVARGIRTPILAKLEYMNPGGSVKDRIGITMLESAEKEGQIKVLSQKLDAAIREVVRAMAKLQGLESKAEAASNLAEAEIALNLLERDGSGREKDSDFIQATQLLKASTQEFKKENYGGALYLASQAKSLIKGEQARSIGGENMPKVEGEVPFSLPLSLRVLTKSNIREGPGPNFKIVFVVEEGARLTGQSHKGLWVRVKSEDGRWGWIFYKLLGPQ